MVKQTGWHALYVRKTRDRPASTAKSRPQHLGPCSFLGLENDMEQQDTVRLQLFNALTRVQHREYGPLVESMRNALHEDPFFMARAAVHLVAGGSNIRDTADC